MQGFIEPLIQKSTETNLEEEIENFLNKTGAPYFWCNDKEQKQWCQIIAEHFFNLGKDASGFTLQQCRTPMVGMTIRIDEVIAESTHFKDGIDHQAKDMEGKTGVIRHIDSTGTMFGSWGGLGIIPGKDKFTIIE